jgi:hypothetical protein
MCVPSIFHKLLNKITVSEELLVGHDMQKSEHVNELAKER